MRAAQSLAADQAERGQRLNQELDQVARNHWGNQAYDAVATTIAHAKEKFNAEELEANFEFFRTGDMTLSVGELHKIAERRIPGDPNDPNIKAGRDFYISNFMNVTGWTGVDLGDWTKAYGAVNYDPVSKQMVDSRVITPDVQNRNVYAAPRTQDGVPIAEGGQPINVAVDSVYDQKMRGYLRNAISSAQIDPNAINIHRPKAAALYREEMPTAQGRFATGEYGVRGSTDPNVNIESVGETSDRVLPGQAIDAAGRRIFTGPQPAVGEQPGGQQLGGQQPAVGEQPAVGQVITQAANPNLEFNLGDSASYFETQGTGPEGTDGAYNPHTNTVYTVRELQRIYISGADALVQQLGGDDFVHAEGSIPFLNREQWEGFSEGQRENILREVKTKSVSNIDKVMSTLQGALDPKQPPLPEPTVTSLRSQGIDIDYLLKDRITFSDQYGPPDAFEGMTEEQTMEAIKNFYDTNLSDESPSYGEKTGIQDPSLQQVMLNHPAYFDQFQILAPAEFARRYMEDPEFAKSMPSRAEQARRIRQVTNISNSMMTNPDYPSLPNPDAITEGIVSQSFVVPGGSKHRVFTDALKGMTQLTTADEDILAALLGEVIDFNIGEADLTTMSMPQRARFGLLLMAGMSQTERTEFGPNIDSLITTGVMKTESDQWPTRLEVASSLEAGRTAAVREWQTGQDVLDTAIEVEEGRADRQQRYVGIAADIQSAQAAVWRTKFDRDSSVAMELFRNAREDFINTQMDPGAVQTFYNQLMNDIPKAPGRTMEDGTYQPSRIDIITAASSAPRGKVGVLAYSDDMMAALNKLAVWSEMSSSQEQHQVLAPQYRNALKAMLRGASENETIWWKPGTWWGQLLEWSHGKAFRQAGDIDINFKMFGRTSNDELYEITDPSQLYHPGYHRNGVMPVEIRVLGPNNEQKGITISPYGIKTGMGNLFYNMLLAQLTENAERRR